MGMKSLVLVSGGLDSATALAYALKGKIEAAAVTFIYDSKHNERELQAAGDIIRHFDVPCYQIKIPNGLFGTGSTLMQGGKEIPNEEYHDASAGKESPSSTIVPFRNAVFLSMAVALAESRGYGYVVIAAHATDAGGFAYPDCSPEFLGAFTAATYIGTLRKVRLFAPFAQLSKAQVVKLGKGLSVPFHLTYSCYRGALHHCGKCPTCVERRAAFSSAGVTDPTIYEDTEVNDERIGDE